MHRSFGSEAPARPEQPGMPLIERQDAHHGRSWMQVEGHVQLGDSAPERTVLRQVIVNGRARIGRRGIAVHQRASKSQIPDTALQLLCRQSGILHRERGNSYEPIRTLADLLRQRIVGPARQLRRLSRVCNALNGRRIERDDHDLDAACVHESKALIVKIQQAVPQLGPHMRTEGLRIPKRRLDRKMILERDLPLHPYAILAQPGGGFLPGCIAPHCLHVRAAESA